MPDLDSVDSGQGTSDTQDFEALIRMYRPRNPMIIVRIMQRDRSSDCSGYDLERLKDVADGMRCQAWR